MIEVNWYDCKNHKEISSCKCGENRICHACGFGSGSMPCSCMRELAKIWEYAIEDAIEESLERYKKAWQVLAD